MFIFWRFVFRPIVRALSRVYRWRQWVATVVLVTTVYQVGEWRRAHGLNGSEPAAAPATELSDRVERTRFVSNGTDWNSRKINTGSCVTGDTLPTCTATVPAGSFCTATDASGYGSVAVHVIATTLTCRTDRGGATCLWTCF